MKEFNNFDAFAKHLEKIVQSYPDKEYAALNTIGNYLEKKAKDSIGYLQKGEGEFNTWSPLAESTKKDKENKGYVFNADYNPLYRTGELKASIGHVVNKAARALYVGSTSDIMIYQELGTLYIPPRSVLGMTLFKERHQIEYMLGNFLVNWITDNRSNLQSKS